jgi:hypothetical protein
LGVNELKPLGQDLGDSGQSLKNTKLPNLKLLDQDFDTEDWANLMDPEVVNTLLGINMLRKNEAFKTIA